MLTVRRASERRHSRHSRRDLWQTFFPDSGDGTSSAGFGDLGGLDDELLPPGGEVPLQEYDTFEVLTYVHSGALAYRDAMGEGGVLQAGEFQCLTSGWEHHFREANASRSDWVHLFKVQLRGTEVALEQHHEQRRFSVADRRQGPGLVGSADARSGSLRLRQEAFVHSLLLSSGKHIVHALSAGRGAWVHVVEGAVTLDDALLGTGDGAGVTGERALSLTAVQESEVLLIDVRDGLARPVWGASRDGATANPQASYGELQSR